MARYAKGRRAVLIDDRSGFKIRYKDARTEWTGTRVHKGDFESKHPQLEPQKYIPAPRGNSLFKPRTDNDSIPTNIPLGPLHGRFSAGAVTNIGKPILSISEVANGLQLNTSRGTLGVALVQPISGLSATSDVLGRTITKTVTVVSSGGNKYAIDGVTQATLNLYEGNTYIFDGSAATVASHPILLSATSNGTHGGGSTYNTGVTYQLDGSTVTQSAYVSGYPTATTRTLTIAVGSGTPTLYYYCHYHSGMGGIAYTPDSPLTINTVENANGLQATALQGNVTKLIGQPLTGLAANAQQGTITLNSTEDANGLQATASIGSVTINTTEDALGLEATAQQGTVGISLTIGLTGLQAVAGRGTIGNQVDATLIPSGLSATASQGSVTAVDITPVAVTGLQATTNRGTINVTSPSWGNFPWGHDTWGQ
jgi:hypothetical protein